MHTTVHAPRTKDHALIISGHDPNRAADVLYACAVAESILTRPRTKKVWSPKIGGNDLELARWSSHMCLTNRYGMERARFAYSNPDRNVYLWIGVARVVTVIVDII